MKKTLMRILLLSVVLFIVNSCFLSWFTNLFPVSYDAYFYIKNSFEDDLTVNMVRSGEDNQWLLHQGDSVHVITYGGSDDFPVDLTDFKENLHDDQFRISVCSSDGALIREWSFKNMNDGDCEFFDERYWKKYNYNEISDGNYAWTTFTFEINPEFLAFSETDSESKGMN